MPAKPRPASASATVLSQVQGHTSGIALGGMGTGGVEIWPDGRLYQWMFPNAKPWANNGHVMKAGPADAPQPAPGDADFLIRIAQKGKRPIYRWLFTGNGFAITTASHFWRHHKYFFIKSFPQVRYEAAFPFANLEFVDPELPVTVKLIVWSPMIPHEVKDSSLPGALFHVAVENRTKAPVEVSVVWQMANVAGFACAKNRQEHTKIEEPGFTAVTMRGGLDEPGHWSSGEQTIWAQGAAGQEVDAIAGNPYFQNLIWSLHRTGHLHGELLPTRLSHEEMVTDIKPWSPPNKGLLCIRQRVAAGKTMDARFGMSWHFPHHVTEKGGEVGHQYAAWFADSLASARYLATHRRRLHDASRVLPNAVMASDLPIELRLALLDQSSTVVKNSHFIADGRFGIQEGHGCCAFNTVDVDHYGSFAQSLLMPALRRVINDMNQAMAHPANGKMYHGHGGGVYAREAGGDGNHGYSRWDVCCQYALQVYRDATWSGDRDMVQRHWPTVLRGIKLIASLDFYGVGLPYVQGGITYDHWNMQGVVGYLAGVYLASLRATEEMARMVGDAESAAWARAAFERGRAGFEKVLWNGKQYTLYYGRRPPGWKPGDDGKGEHKALDAVRPDPICCAEYGCKPPKTVVEISDTGVMTDLLNGDGTARVMGLGGILDPKRVQKYLKLVLAKNIQEENRCLVNGSYPDDHFLDEWPFMQWQTPWTGTEYAFAMMAYSQGLVAEGDRVVRLVHERHMADGMRFDHAECNNHYARPLVIWGAWAARVGLRLNAIEGRIGLATPDGKPYRGVLVTGSMVATCVYRPGKELTITCHSGSQAIRTLELGGAPKRVAKTVVKLAGVAVGAEVAVADGIASVVLDSEARLAPGQTITVALR